MNSDFPQNEREKLEAKLTALLLGELPAHEAAALHRAMEADPELAALYERLKFTIGLVRESAVTPATETSSQPAPLKLSEEKREKLLAHFKTIAPKEFAEPPARRGFRLLELVAVVAIIATLAAMLLPALSKAKSKASSVAVLSNLRQLDIAKQMWAEENKKKPDDAPTFEDLKPYLGGGNGRIPSVGGEKYVPGKVSESPKAEASISDAKKLFGSRAADRGEIRAGRVQLSLDDMINQNASRHSIAAANAGPASEAGHFQISGPMTVTASLGGKGELGGVPPTISSSLVATTPQQQAGVSQDSFGLAPALTPQPLTAPPAPPKAQIVLPSAEQSAGNGQLAMNNGWDQWTVDTHNKAGSLDRGQVSIDDLRKGITDNAPVYNFQDSPAVTSTNFADKLDFADKGVALAYNGPATNYVNDAEWRGALDQPAAKQPENKFVARYAAANDISGGLAALQTNPPQQVWSETVSGETNYAQFASDAGRFKSDFIGQGTVTTISGRESKVPVLGDVPQLGNLYRDESKLTGTNMVFYSASGLFEGSNASVTIAAAGNGDAYDGTKFYRNLSEAGDANGKFESGLNRDDVGGVRYLLTNGAIAASAGTAPQEWTKNGSGALVLNGRDAALNWWSYNGSTNSAVVASGGTVPSTAAPPPITIRTSGGSVVVANNGSGESNIYLGFSGANTYQGETVVNNGTLARRGREAADQSGRNAQGAHVGGIVMGPIASGAVQPGFAVNGSGGFGGGGGGAGGGERIPTREMRPATGGKQVEIAAAANPAGNFPDSSLSDADKDGLSSISGKIPASPISGPAVAQASAPQSAEAGSPTSGNNNGGRGLRYVTGLDPGSEIQTAVTERLRQAGVDLTPPKSVFFNDRQGTLTVHATDEDLNKVEALVKELNSKTQPVASASPQAGFAGQRPVVTAPSRPAKPSVSNSQTRQIALAEQDRKAGEAQAEVKRLRENLKINDATASGTAPYLEAKAKLEEEKRWRQVLAIKTGQESVDVALPRSRMVTIIDPATASAESKKGFLADLFGSKAVSTARITVEQEHPDITGIAGSAASTAYDPYFLQTEFETIQSHAVLSNTVKSLNLTEDGKVTEEDAERRLKKSLDLRPVKNTKLIEIKAYDDDPQQAARVANAVAQAYRQYRSEEYEEIKNRGIKSLQQQINDQDKKVDLAQAKVDELAKQLNISAPAAGVPSQQTDAALPKPAVPPPTPQPEILTRENAFSTFSLNVSDVSFKLAAASLEKAQMPEPASIRSEEFINAFDYRDPEAPAGTPIAFACERARYPFAHNRELLRFSLKTAAAGRQAGRPLNIVLLLDNSGSMERADRVNIIREALRVLATQLQPQDTFSLVTFARTPQLRVDGVPGNQAAAAADEIAKLNPEGGTNLGEALDLAYQTALHHYLASGDNRVVVLTDGAANLGDVNPDTLKQKVEANRKQGIALDCFGIGWEGFNDDLLEVLTRNGDGRYGFINTPEEASTTFVAQIAGALNVAASDVKVQVEFNPKRVTSYRQIGYAKHQLTKEQFRDNTVDAAEIAAKETGNALYTVETNPQGEGPVATVHVRYKIPGTTDYREQAWDVAYTGSATSMDQSSPAMRLAATASAFSEWLATSPFAAEVTPDQLLNCVSGVPQVYGADTRPQKLEWMIRQARSISGK